MLIIVKSLVYLFQMIRNFLLLDASKSLRFGTQKLDINKNYFLNRHHPVLKIVNIKTFNAMKTCKSILNMIPNVKIENILFRKPLKY